MSVQVQFKSYAESSEFNKKLLWAVVGAAIFVGVSLPEVYSQTDKLTSKYFHTYDQDCPTAQGKFLHAAVFFAVNYFVMKWAASSGGLQKTDGQLAKCAFYATLLFFLVASSDSYTVTNSLYPGLANDGCPTLKGVLVHGLVFLVLLVLVMYFPKD